ncbi:IS3 family transposase [Palleronia caenipelagi]|uniref:IS3 family transposase n=1 Tax=Palleronia caenipelagi TaxID=2489174 RepID=A0A547PLB1_9RHOB|nr:IS3 family transposase [Palleronia caenipelagi]TRD14906.1 IS3 family transposase [Palleronia caenipelagi]
MNKHAFITAHKAQYGVLTLCRLVRLSRSWFYGYDASWAALQGREGRRAAQDVALLERIRHFFKASKGRYGSKRIHRDLRADGVCVSERRVARIMRENRISARLRKPRKPVTTNSNHKLTPSPNLLGRAFHCTTPNTVWLADITYVGTGEGWLYLAAVKDMASREIVGWSMADHLGADLCCDALRMALDRRGPVPGLIAHSDRGVQYASGDYRKIIHRARLIQSMSRKGQCLDNAPMESFFSSLKKELVHRQRFATRAQATAAIFEYIGVFYGPPAPPFSHRLPDTGRGFRRNELENRRVGSTITLSGNRDEDHLRVSTRRRAGRTCRRR